MSATCSSTSEHHTRSTLAVVERERPVRLEQPQVGAGRVAARALERRLGDLHADRVGARVAQRGDEAARAAAEVEHALAGPRLGEQQRPPALPRPRLGILRRVRPEGFVVGAHRPEGTLSSDAAAADPSRDGAALNGRAADRSWTRCSILRARGRRSRTRRTSVGTRWSSCPSRPRSWSRASTRWSSPTCTRTTSTRPRSRCCPRTCRCSAQPEDAETCAGTGSPMSARSTTRVDWDGTRDHAHRRAARHGPDRRRRRGS